jgi:hypothetical protein
VHEVISRARVPFSDEPARNELRVSVQRPTSKRRPRPSLSFPQCSSFP